MIINSYSNSFLNNKCTIGAPKGVGLSFLGNFSYENVNGEYFDKLIHHTSFFREPKTDELVTSYIRDSLSSNSEINIVVGACSSGEEAYSYSMMLDDLSDKVQIKAFDVSEKSISESKKGVYVFNKSYPDYFLVNKDLKLKNPFVNKCRDKFFEFFEPKKEKKNTFVLRKGKAFNVSFRHDDIANLSNMYKKGSVDVFLFRNAMYHLVCADDYSREMRPDGYYILKNVLQDIDFVLKPEGLIVFGENEERQGVDVSYINAVLKKSGYKQLSKARKGNVWKKCLSESKNKPSLNFLLYLKNILNIN